jgi:hypothetical protein
MQLKPREQKMVDVWRKQQRQWPVNRWIALIGTALSTFLCVYSMSWAYQEVMMFRHQSELLLSEVNQASPKEAISMLVTFDSIWRDNLLAVALIFPFWLLFAACTLYISILLVVNWRGHADRDLLLKLLNEQQAETDKNPRA